MGAQQVLRAATGGLILLAAVATAAPAETNPTGSAAETLLVIDLRQGDSMSRGEARRALEETLERLEGVAPTRDRELAAALADEHPLAEPAREAMAGAASAFGALDCPRAEAQAREAVRLLAALATAGEDATEPLQRAYVYRLLCADQHGDPDLAMRSAAHLRTLGAPDPPPGVPPRVWDSYPELDAAAGSPRGELTVETVPRGAAVAIDHRPAGRSPLTVPVAHGERLVSAARDGAAGAVHVTVGGLGAEISLPLIGEDEARMPIRERIHAWRTGAEEPTPRSLAALLYRTGARFALVLAAPDTVELWGVPPRSDVATLLGRGEDAATHGRRILERRRAWYRGPGPEPGVALLREDPAERDRRRDDKTSWWVYGTLAAAVVFGVVLVGANELGRDRQRFEIDFP